MNTKLSKFLSYVLRHEPGSIGATLDSNGWINVETLIQLASDHGTAFTKEELQDVVDGNDKKRFTLETINGILFIRAAQGHSTTQVKMQMDKRVPPDILYHGTAMKNLQSIKLQGLIPGKRHHVHLSTNIDTATMVGARHGKPIILKVNAKEMHDQGYHFYLSDNDVWLTDNVPPTFISE